MFKIFPMRTKQQRECQNVSPDLDLAGKSPFINRLWLCFNVLHLNINEHILEIYGYAEKAKHYG